MFDIVAKAGEAVTTADGTVVCYVKNDLRRNEIMSDSDFHNFADGEIPWIYGGAFDPRCIRETPLVGNQICINGEWRPSPKGENSA